MIKIIFLDFDGTVYSHSSRSIPASAIEAINELSRKGILIYLCSGRSKYEMKEFDLSMINIDGMILTNGQVIVDMNDNIIFEKPIEGELKDIAVRMFNEKKIPVYLATFENLIMNYIDDKVIETQKAVSTSIPTVGEYHGETFHMFSAFTSNKEQYEEIMKLKETAEVTFWHEGVVDVVPRGTSKALGIDKVLERHNLDISETMGIGDGENDYEMIEHCSVGIAMGNAKPIIKEIANYITDDIDNDGLYKALKYYELI